MDLSETTPKMDLAIQDIEHLVEALRAYHALSSPLLQRRAQREAAPASFQGLLATVPRKSMAPMVLAVDGVAPKAVRAMPSLIRAGQWHDARRLSQHGKAVDPALGAAEGVLMVDGRAFPQQGVQSVGVKRQYGGELGKRAHCQAGGCIGSVSAPGDTLLERRWYVPAAGRTDDTYAARRQQGGRPVETPCNTKPAWARR